MRNTRKLRARLLHQGKSVPSIARKYGAKVSSVYAILCGSRNGKRTPAALAAVEEIKNA